MTDQRNPRREPQAGDMLRDRMTGRKRRVVRVSRGNTIAKSFVCYARDGILFPIGLAQWRRWANTADILNRAEITTFPGRVT